MADAAERAEGAAARGMESTSGLREVTGKPVEQEPDIDDSSRYCTMPARIAF